MHAVATHASVLADFCALISPFSPLKKFIIVLLHSSYALVILFETERTVIRGSFIGAAEFCYLLITGIIAQKTTKKTEEKILRLLHKAWDFD